MVTIIMNIINETFYKEWKTLYDDHDIAKRFEYIFSYKETRRWELGTGWRL